MKDERGELYGEKHYRGYFFADVYNWAQDPPYGPPYNDLVVEPGITLTPSGAVVDGSPLDAVAVVRNVGDYPVRLRSLNFWFRAPDVTDPSKYRHPFATPVTLPFVLKPGEERNVGGHAASFGGRPGVHAAAVTANVSGDPGKPLPRGSTGKSSQTSIRVRVRPETDAAPAAASLGKTLYLFHKGLNNRIYVNAASDGAPFAGWAEVQDDGRTDRAVAAAPLGKRIYVFARGIEDRRVYVNSALEGRAFDGFGAGWSEVQPNGFTARTSPAAAAFDGRLHVFAVGDDRLVHVNSAADGSPFSGWSPLPIAGAPDNGTDLPVAAAAIGNRLYVFCVFDEGLSAGVYYCTRVAGQPFSAWKPVDGGLSVDGSAPAAAVLGDRVYVFAKKGDCIYANSARAGAPFDGFGSGWRELPGGGKTDRAVAAASLGNRIHCFAKGSDDKHLYVNSAVEGHAFGLWSEVPW
jgi:hypothetical protein